jgi:hypothetical protein
LQMVEHIFLYFDGIPNIIKFEFNYCQYNFKYYMQYILNL